MSLPHIVLAEKFARSVSDGQFPAAYEMFTSEQKKRLPIAQLKKEYEEMISYGGGPVTRIEVMQALDVWPEKNQQDIGWVYVAIAGDDFSEAVTVIVSNESNRQAIRSVEWGRP